MLLLLEATVLVKARRQKGQPAQFYPKSLSRGLSLLVKSKWLIQGVSKVGRVACSPGIYLKFEILFFIFEEQGAVLGQASPTSIGRLIGCNVTCAPVPSNANYEQLLLLASLL